MNPDDVDSLLHDYARRWTGRQPEPPPVPALPAPSPTTLRWRSRVLVLAACLVVGVVAAVGAPAPRPAGPASRPAGPILPAAVRERLIRLVDRLAVPEHGTVTAQAVRTTYGRAEAAVLAGETDSYPPPSTPVWVVQVRGYFDCGGCKIPPGMTAPHGRVFTFVARADTYDEIDYTVGNELHEMARLGAVAVLIG